jgi:hypothetical protein
MEKEKTETKPAEEVTAPAEVAAPMEATVEKEKIEDYYAKRWYNEGFRFAIHYIHAMLPLAHPEQKELNRANFKAELARILLIGIDDNYFRDHPFSVGNYPDGQCPGDRPGTCIQCADPNIRPLP